MLLEFTVSFAIQVNPEDSNLCANYCYGISRTEPSTWDRIRLAKFQIGVVALSEVECEILFNRLQFGSENAKECCSNFE